MKQVWTDKIVRRVAGRMPVPEEVALRSVPEGIERLKDLPCESRDGASVPFDIYVPVSEPGRKLPVILYIHGGGLLVGHKNMSIDFCAMLAGKGFIVCALDYRLVPDVRIYEALADVSAGMDAAAAFLRAMNTDPDRKAMADLDRIYLTADSAGAFLSIYANAMSCSPEVALAVGYVPSNVRIRAMALISGMFYTRRPDSVGLLRWSFYGKGQPVKRMKPYADPEVPEVLENLPPCLLTTSRADFLKKYSVDYAAALLMKNIESRLIDYGEDERLIHAFPTIRPSLPESGQVVEAIAEWFEKH